MRIKRPDRPPDVSFEVVGQPKTAGSKDPHMRQMKDGTVKMWVSDQSDEKGKAWRTAVGYAAAAAMNGRPLITAPVYLEITVLRQRGGGHFGQGRNRDLLLPSAPRYPSTKPDTTKLLRAIEDAMTGICWRDDSQCVHIDAEKSYARPGEPGGAIVAIWELEVQLGDNARVTPDQLALSA